MAQSVTVRILYIEDDAGLVRLAQKRLQRAGYIVDIAGDGNTGLEMLEAGQYDVLAVDHDMPGSDGVEIIKTLRSRGSLPPTVMITGRGDERLAVNAMKAGAADYIVKDAAGKYVETLPGIIERLLERQQLFVEKKAAENALKKNEEHFRAVVETANDAIITADNRGDILAWNHGAQVMFGYSSEEILGQSLTLIMSEQYRKAHQSGLQRFVSGGAPVVVGKTVELTGLRKQGSEFPLELSIATWKSGEEHYFTAIIRDLTERMQAEEAKDKLEAQKRQFEKTESLGRMAAGIAHHFNNRLYVVAGNLEMVLEDLPPDTGLAENLAEAQAATRQATELSRLMLTYLGQSPEKTKPYDLSEICSRHILQLSPVLPKGVHLETDYSFPGPIIEVSPGQMRKIQTILVDNALEAMDGFAGKVQVSVNTVSAGDIRDGCRFPLEWVASGNLFACLSVADQGCGIDADMITNIFDPFFSDKFIGRGLGLAVVLGIVKTHDGVIMVNSEPGKGSVFQLFLPLAEQSADQGGTRNGLP